VKKWWGLWIFCIPVFIISFTYSFFITSKIAYLPQSECKPMFIFTPQDVQYCSEIYPIDIFLISLITEPLSYVCLLAGLYLIGFIIYLLIKMISKRGKVSQ
jgi:hypothetical protein